ncbi:MAG: hypothetical protein EP338_03105 [Bacteroidetes bacterium]|nr:MAG: hypothetical protein EP338_03105 [Bacteroidota bacterium]
MKPTLNIAWFFLCGINLFAQDDVHDTYYPVSNIELNYLYRDYDNRLAYSAPDIYDTTIIELDIPASISYYLPNKVSVRINSNSKKANIKVLGVMENDTILVSTHEFIVKPLPEPNVYLHNSTIYGSGAYNYEPVEKMFNGILLISKYPPEIELKEKFKVIEWNITVGDVEFVGKGNVISEQVCDAIYNSPKKTIVRINSVKIQSTYREFKIDIPLIMYKTSDVRTFKPIEYKPIICD